MKEPSKAVSDTGFRTKVPGPWYSALVLLLILAFLFHRSFLPGYVHFSNDGPLGVENSASQGLPQSFTGLWSDLNTIGVYSGAAAPDVTSLIRWILGPVGYAKFLAPVALFILGLGAVTFFRSLKLSALAICLGAVAIVLNSTFLSGACWSVASVEIGMGFNFMAMALIVGASEERSILRFWLRYVLAGLCVGINVMESSDVGALFSMMVAAFAFCSALIEPTGNWMARTARGVSRIAVVAVFAGFIAMQALAALVSSQIQGIAGTSQDAAIKAGKWDFATQWSLPKAETLSLVIPGLYGYRMDTPEGIWPRFEDDYRGGVYWGGVGRDPAIDRYFDSGGVSSPPAGFMRFTGGENYCGILVFLVAIWGFAQACRGQLSPFSTVQKKLVWFWAAILVLSILIAWGRFAPFYLILYQLPYFSTIRNPTKFLLFFSVAITVLFTYGVDSLSRRQLSPTNSKSKEPFGLFDWWTKAEAFYRQWVVAGWILLVVSIIGWWFYNGQKPALTQYLLKTGFPNEDFAESIANFSVNQVGCFVLLLAVALVLINLVILGFFKGRLAYIGGFLLALFLILDLVRADIPYVIHWDYYKKYEVGSLNPVLEFLRKEPYEHRVAALPFDSQGQLRGYDNYFGGNGLYRIEWAQHHFPYYDIQSLDIIQMPRMPEDLKAYYDALSPRSMSDIALTARLWQLTNTRYLLGAAGFLNVLNTDLDPGKDRFKIAQRFDLVAKKGIDQPAGLEDMTASNSPDGDLAVIDFAGALPRAKLYSRWQVQTNDTEVLHTLTDLNFDPENSVLVSGPPSALPATGTNDNDGTVDFKSYAPKSITLATKSATSSVLLLNDKYDPHWKVTIDGQAAPLLRCNFIMRGVLLPPGEHTVVFAFGVANGPLYITLAAFAIGLVLLAILCFTRKMSQVRHP